jgi:hypothetical protein
MATSFALSTPIPPLTLFERQSRVLCLGHRGSKDIETTNVLRLSLQPAEIPVHLPRILAHQLGHATNSQEVQISQHGRANRHQIL